MPEDTVVAMSKEQEEEPPIPQALSDGRGWGRAVSESPLSGTP